MRLLRQLVVRGLLAEKLVVNNDIASAYVVLGPNVDKYELYCSFNNIAGINEMFERASTLDRR